MRYAYQKSTIDYATRTAVELAAFRYDVNWTGVSDLLSTWDINNSSEFSLQLPITAPNSTFLLCVAWEDSGGNAFRYKLWDGGVLHYPVYNGERIGVDAKLEVWSIESVTAELEETFTMYSSHLEEPEICRCTQNTVSAHTIEFPVPSGGTPSDTPMIISSFLAIQGATELRTLTDYVDNQYAYLEFLATAGDGTGGAFVFDAASTATDDGRDYIKPNDILSASPGRWVRQNNP